MQQEFLYVYQLYKEGSFSKAAQQLHITQPALSIAIQKIETSIGMPLFDRSRRPLQLTSAGEIYIHSIEKMIRLEQELTQQLSDIHDLKTGTIRIGGSHYLNAYILPELLQNFNQMYPGIQLQIIEAGSNELFHMLSEHQLDVTFSCNPTPIDTFERYPFFYDQLLLAVPKDLQVDKQLQDYTLSAADIMAGKHLNADCPVADFQMFRNLDYILLTEGNNLHDRAFQLFRQAGFSPRIKLQLSQQVTAYHLAIAEFGSTFVSDRIVQSAEVPLNFYKLDEAIGKRLFYIFLPHQSYVSNASKKLINFLLTSDSPQSHTPFR